MTQAVEPHEPIVKSAMRRNAVYSIRETQRPSVINGVRALLGGTVDLRYIDNDSGTLYVQDTAASHADVHVIDVAVAVSRSFASEWRNAYGRVLRPYRQPGTTNAALLARTAFET